MSLERVARTGLAELVAVTGRERAAVIGLEPEGTGWRLTVELVEKESIPRAMDVLGTYRALLDAEGHLRGFQRLGLRHRGDTAARGLETV